MQTLEFDRYYHIYNRGVNSCSLFEENSNFEHFLHLYEKYILPVADTFAYCLMPNHFHFLVKIKKEKEIGYYKKINTDGSNDSVRFQTETISSDLSESATSDRVSQKEKTKPLKTFLAFI